MIFNVLYNNSDIVLKNILHKLNSDKVMHPKRGSILQTIRVIDKSSSLKVTVNLTSYWSLIPKTMLSIIF